jgi:hypothetical protein
VHALPGWSLATEVWPYSFAEWLAADPAKGGPLTKGPHGQRALDQLRPRLLAAFRMGAEDLGQRFENLVYLDLRRQGCDVAYYLTRSRKEVDFVVRHPDGHQELLQACWDARDPATLSREQEALAEAEAELGLPGRILTVETYLEG